MRSNTHGRGEKRRRRCALSAQSKMPGKRYQKSEVSRNQNMTTKITQKITPFLWFDDKAEEAAKFYTAIFKNSKVGRITRYDEESVGPTGRPAGSVMTVEFELEGQEFVGLNGGPMFKFTEAISFVVNCESQEEVDYFWSKISADGEKS